MIPLSIAIGIGAAIINNWWVVAAMAFNLTAQVLNFRTSRQRLGNRDSDLPPPDF